MRFLYKKGEVSSTTIITLIIPIIAFLIVAFLLVRTNFGDFGEDEVCKLSVLTRATSPEAAQSLIPLKCSTDKICLTSDGGKCERSFAGEDPVIVKLPRDDEKAARLIEEVSVEGLYECWQDFGEGKLDIFGNYKKHRGLIASDGPVCVICARVALDKSVDEKIVKEVDLHEYMSSHNIPGGEISYLNALTDRSVNSYADVDGSFEDALKNDIESSNEEFDVSNSRRELGIVFMQIKSQEVSESLSALGKDALLVGGSAFLTPKVRVGVPKTAFALGRGVGLARVAVGAGVAGYAAINAYSSQILAAGYCGAMASKNGGKDGCSIVQTVPYDFETINGICPDIEGNP